MEKSFPVVSRIEEDKIKRIMIEIREIKENMVTKEDIENINELKNRIDEIENNFRREYRKLKNRISELENNYENVAKIPIRIMSIHRLKRILCSPLTFLLYYLLL